jgi:putative ABC transport system substrate-binding protein
LGFNWKKNLKEIVMPHKIFKTTLWFFVLILVFILTLRPIEPTEAKTKIYKIGVLQLPAPYAVEMEQGFRKRLKFLGYEKGKNLEYILRIVGPEKTDYEKNKEVARELLNAGVDLIATIGTGASTPVWPVVKGTGVPMVFAGVTYPIEGGLIKEFDKPTGTNITGLSYGVSPETRLKLFRKMFPDRKRFKRLGFVYSGVMEQEIDMVKDLKGLKETSGFELKYIDFCNYELGKPDFGILEKNVRQADLFFGWYTLDGICADSSLLKRLTALPIPILGITSKFTDVGAIGGILTDHFALGAEQANMVAKILSGADPGKIPPKQPSTYLVEINLKKARQLNIEIPLEMIGAASRVVSK